MNNKGRVGYAEDLRSLVPVFVLKQRFIKVKNLLLPRRMKANFWLINKNKRASERIRIFHHKAPTIDYLLFTGAKLIHPHIVAILFKENFFMAVAINNTVVFQVVKHQIKGFGKPRHPLRNLKF